MTYLAHLVIFLCIYGIVALSLNLMVGLGGLLTLAHASFFAVGAYAYAITSTSLGAGFLLSLVVASGAAAVLSLAITIPAWRFRGDYFVLSTLAVQAMLLGLIKNWSDPMAEVGTWSNLTGGSFGIGGIPSPAIAGITSDTISSMLVISLLSFAGSALVIRSLTNSPWGRMLRALRDDELAARALGKDAKLVKLQAIAFSCVFAAVGGVLYASYVGYVDPSSASLDHSILMLSMVVVGGLGNFKGPLAGAAFMVLLPELLRLIAIPAPIAASIRILAFGLLMVLVIHVRPQGIAGDYRLQQSRPNLLD